MTEVLAWYIAGPVMGLLVVVLAAIGNLRIGVSGSYRMLVSALRGRAVDEPWRLWFGGALLAGALLAGLVRGPAHPLAYGVLGDVLPGWALPPVLLAGGVLIGFGARWAGGCTSGHGLGGCSRLSPASLVATAAFFGTAVAVTWALHVLTGGAL